MKAVNQTTFGVPGGNCFSACVASILELPIYEVPYFMSNDINSFEWFEKFKLWLMRRGRTAYIDRTNMPIFQYHIMHGDSPRGIGTHAVVGLQNKIIHDPHPSKQGILNVHFRTIIY